MSTWRAPRHQGLVAIVRSSRRRRLGQDFQRPSPISASGGSYGIDRDAICYAGSGNVYTAFPIVEDPKQTMVKAAVMYYGPRQSRFVATGAIVASGADWITRRQRRRDARMRAAASAIARTRRSWQVPPAHASR